MSSARRVRLTRRSVVASLLALTALLPTVGAVPSAGAAPEPLRVMFVGDSMTQGIPGSATYRYWLWRELVDQGVPATFVGPRTDLNTPSHDEAVRHAYELLDHGFDAQLAHAAQGGSEFAYHLPLIAGEVSAYRPDVIVLQLGFNDTWHHTGDQIAADTRTLLDLAWAVDPDIEVVLGEIPPSALPGDERRARDASAAAANAANALAFAGDPRVAIAHHVTGPGRRWDPALDTFDGIHPNAVGETRFAFRFAQALARLGVVAGPVQRYHRPDWAPALPLTVRAGRRRVLVDLRKVWRIARPYRVRARVRDDRGRLVRDTGWTRAHEVAFRLPAGSYTVTPVVRRHLAMVSKPGTAVAVRVR